MDCWYCLACISTDMCQQQLYCKTEVKRSHISNLSPCTFLLEVINKYITHLFVFVHRHIKLYIHSWLFNTLHVSYFINQHPIKWMVSVVNLALLCLSAPCCELKRVSALKCQARLCPFKRGDPDNHFYLILDLQNQVHMMQGFFLFTFCMPDTYTTSEKKETDPFIHLADIQIRSSPITGNRSWVSSIFSGYRKCKIANNSPILSIYFLKSLRAMFIKDNAYKTFAFRWLTYHLSINFLCSKYYGF